MTSRRSAAVVGLDPGSLTVLFDSVGYKTLAASVVRERELLELLEDPA